jgi:hypothetical protein
MSTQNRLGEVVAAGICNAATPPVLTGGYGVLSVARSAKGSFTATLFNECDPGCCVVDCIPMSAGTIATVNESGADTDSVKNFRITDAAGAAADVQFSFKVTRTRYVPA